MAANKSPRVRLEPGPIIRTPVSLHYRRKQEIAKALQHPNHAVIGKMPELRIAAVLLTRNFKSTPLGKDDFKLVGVEVIASTRTGETRIIQWTKENGRRYIERYKQMQVLILSRAPAKTLVRTVSLDTITPKAQCKLELWDTYGSEVLSTPLDIHSGGEITGTAGTRIPIPLAPLEFTSGNSPYGHPATYQIREVVRAVLKTIPQYAGLKLVFLKPR